MAYNPLHKLNDNLAAIRIALAYELGGVRGANEKEALSRYAGYGVSSPYSTRKVIRLTGQQMVRLKLI